MVVGVGDMWEAVVRNKKAEWINLKLTNLLPAPPVKMRIHAKDGREWVQRTKVKGNFYISWNGERFSHNSDYAKLHNLYPDLEMALMKYLQSDSMSYFDVGHKWLFRERR